LEPENHGRHCQWRKPPIGARGDEKGRGRRRQGRRKGQRREEESMEGRWSKQAEIEGQSVGQR
jgi:hypothetical protein